MLLQLNMSLLDSIGKLSWTVNNISLYHVFVLRYSLKAFTRNKCLGSSGYILILGDACRIWYH